MFSGDTSCCPRPQAQPAGQAAARLQGKQHKSAHSSAHHAVGTKPSSSSTGVHHSHCPSPGGLLLVPFGGCWHLSVKRALSATALAPCKALGPACAAQAAPIFLTLAGTCALDKGFRGAGDAGEAKPATQTGRKLQPLVPSSTPGFGQNPAMQFSSTQFLPVPGQAHPQQLAEHRDPSGTKNTQKDGMRVPAEPNRPFWIAPLMRRSALNTIPSLAFWGFLFFTSSWPKFPLHAPGPLVVGSSSYISEKQFPESAVAESVTLHSLCHVPTSPHAPADTQPAPWAAYSWTTFSKPKEWHFLELQ